MSSSQRLAREVKLHQRWASMNASHLDQIEIPTLSGPPVVLPAGFDMKMVLGDLSEARIIACTPHIPRMLGCLRQDLIAASSRGMIRVNSGKYASMMNSLVSGGVTPESSLCRFVLSSGHLERNEERVVIWGTTPAQIGHFAVVINVACPMEPALFPKIDLHRAALHLDAFLHEAVHQANSVLFEFFKREFDCFVHEDMVQKTSFFRKNFLLCLGPAQLRVCQDRAAGNIVPVEKDELDIAKRCAGVSSCQSCSMSECGDAAPTSELDNADVRDPLEFLLFYLTPGMELRVGSFDHGGSWMNGTLVTTKSPPLVNRAKANKKPKLRVVIEYSETVLEYGNKFPRDVHVSKVLEVVRREDRATLLQRQLADPKGEVVSQILNTYEK